jgi:hypothetical protein
VEFLQRQTDIKKSDVIYKDIKYSALLMPIIDNVAIFIISISSITQTTSIGSKMKLSSSNELPLNKLEKMLFLLLLRSFFIDNTARSCSTWMIVMMSVCTDTRRGVKKINEREKQQELCK